MGKFFSLIILIFIFATQASATDVINYNCDGSSGLGFVSKTSTNVTKDGRVCQRISGAGKYVKFNALISRNKGFIQLQTKLNSVKDPAWNILFGNFPAPSGPENTFLIGHSAFGTYGANLDALQIKINGVGTTEWLEADLPALEDKTQWHTLLFEWDRENPITGSDGRYVAMTVNGVMNTTYGAYSITTGWDELTDTAQDYYLGNDPTGAWYSDRWFDNVTAGDIPTPITGDDATLPIPTYYDLTVNTIGLVKEWTVDDWATSNASGDTLNLADNIGYTIKYSTDNNNDYAKPDDEVVNLSADTTISGTYVAYPDTQVTITASGITSGDVYFTVDAVERDDYTEYLLGATHTIKSGPRQIRFVNTQLASKPLDIYNYNMLPAVTNEIEAIYLANSPLVVQSPLKEIADEGKYDIFLTSLYWGKHVFSTDDHHIVVYYNSASFASVIIYDMYYNIVKNAVIGTAVADTAHDRVQGHIDNTNNLFIQVGNDLYRTTYSLDNPDFFTSAIDNIPVALTGIVVKDYGSAYATDSNNKTHAFNSSQATGVVDYVVSNAVYVGETLEGSGIHRFLVGSLEFPAFSESGEYEAQLCEVRYTTIGDTYTYHDINGNAVTDLTAGATVLPFTSGISSLGMKTDGTIYGIISGARADTAEYGLWYWEYNGSDYSYTLIEDSVFSEYYCYSDSVNDPLDVFSEVDLTIGDATYQAVNGLLMVSHESVDDDIIVVTGSSYCQYQKRGFNVSYITNNGGNDWQRISQISDTNFGHISKPNVLGKFLQIAQSVIDPYGIVGIPMQTDFTGTIGSITVDIEGGDGTEWWSPDGGGTELMDLGSINLEQGQYTLTFGPVTGSETPYPINITIEGGEIRKEYVTYVTGDYGDLTVDISGTPEGVDGRYSIDNGVTWHTSGKIKVAPGVYSVTFAYIVGGATPSTIEGVIIANGSDIIYNVSYGVSSGSQGGRFGDSSFGSGKFGAGRWGN